MFMRHPAPGDSGPPHTRRGDTAPLRTYTDAIVFLALFAGLSVTLLLETDWDPKYVGATASCLGSTGALVSYLIREARWSKSGGRRQRQALLGAPPATVSTLDTDAPPPPSSAEDGTPDLIEIPGERL